MAVLNVDMRVQLANNQMIEEEYPFSAQEQKEAEEVLKVAYENFKAGKIKPLELRKTA